MGKGSAPPPPDYEAAAVAQGQANRETAQYNTGANRVNQYTPQGSSTWTTRPGADPNNPQPGDYIQTTTLSPEQQRQYDEGNRITESLMGTAGRQLDRVDQTFNSPIDLSGLPSWRTSGQTGAQPSPTATNPSMAAAPAGSSMAMASPQVQAGGNPQGLEALLSAMLAAQSRR